MTDFYTDAAFRIPLGSEENALFAKECYEALNELHLGNAEYSTVLFDNPAILSKTNKVVRAVVEAIYKAHGIHHSDLNLSKVTNIGEYLHFIELGGGYFGTEETNVFLSVLLDTLDLDTTFSYSVADYSAGAILGGFGGTACAVNRNGYHSSTTEDLEADLLDLLIT